MSCRTREGRGWGAIFLGHSYYRTKETGIKIRPRGPHSLYAPLPFLNDNEITLPRQISRVSWVLSYQVCNREKYKIIISLSKSLGLSTESVVSFSSNNILATRFTSKEDFIVCYTAVFSVVTQRSSPLAFYGYTDIFPRKVIDTRLNGAKIRLDVCSLLSPAKAKRH